MRLPNRRRSYGPWRALERVNVAQLALHIHVAVLNRIPFPDGLGSVSLCKHAAFQSKAKQAALWAGSGFFD